MSDTPVKPKRGRPKKEVSSNWMDKVEATTVPTLFDVTVTDATLSETIPPAVAEAAPTPIAANEPVNLEIANPAENSSLPPKKRTSRRKKEVAPIEPPEVVNATPVIEPVPAPVVTDDPAELGPIPEQRVKPPRQPFNWMALMFALFMLLTIGGSTYYLGFVYELPLVQPQDLTLRVDPTAVQLHVSHPHAQVSLIALLDNDPSTLYTSAPIPQGEFFSLSLTFATPTALEQLVLTPRHDIFDIGLITSLRIFAKVNDEMLLMGEFTGLKQQVHTLKLTAVPSTEYQLLVTGQRGNVVSLADLTLYQRDIVREHIDALVVNGRPRPGLNQAELDRLQTAIVGHPMAATFAQQIATTRSMMLGSQGRYFPLVGRPSEQTEQSRMRTIYTMNGLEPTGLYGTPGESLQIVYPALPNNTSLNVCFSRFYSFHESAYDCTPITTTPTDLVVPASYLGPIYLQYTGPLDARMQVEVLGGTPFPLYREGTPIALYEDALRDYNATQPLGLPDPSVMGSSIASGELLDVTELVSDQVVITIPASTAIQTYLGHPMYNAQRTLSEWDERLTDLVGLLGFDSQIGINHTPYLRENLRAMTSSALTHVQHRFVSLNINPTLYTKVLQDPTEAFTQDLITELSSRYSLNAYNNFYDMDNAMVQLLVEYQLYRLGKPYLMEAPEILNKLFSDLYRPNLDFATLSSVEQMAIHWQLAQYYGFDWYGQAMRTIRQNSHLLNHATLEANTSDWVYILSNVVQNNLDLFFEKYRFTISNEVRINLQTLPAAPTFLTYVDANYSAIPVRSVPFYHQAQIASITQVGDSYRLEIAVDAGITDQILGYFIYRDGQEIGFTSSRSYIDNSAQIGDLHRYSVRPLTRRGNLLSASPLADLRELWYPRDFDLMSICNGLFCTSPDQYRLMFDRNPKTLWITTSTTTHTLIIEMPSHQDFYGLAIQVPSDYVGPSVRDFTIATSEDGILWSEPLFTANFTAGTTVPQRGIYFSSPVHTRFVRIQLNGYNDGISIGELKLFVRSNNTGVLTVIVSVSVVSMIMYALWILHRYRQAHAGLPTVMPLASVLPLDVAGTTENESQ